MVDLRDPATLPAVREVADLEVAGAAGDLPARLYLPSRNAPRDTGRADAGEPPVPTLVFLHGGGWVIGDLDTHEATCRTFCREVGVAVLSVAYRLAPEHPFPAGVEDAVAATRWAAEHRAELGGPGAPLAIGGDSAGGNLAAVACQMLRGTDAAPAAQVLIYPAVDFVEERPSVTDYAEGHLLTRDDMHWFARHYLGSEPESFDIDKRDGLDDPRLSPLRGDLRGLPPAVMATAECDPLRDEGMAYATALEAAGVPVRHRCHPGMIHGFFDFAPYSLAAMAAVRSVCLDLACMLGTAETAAPPADIGR